MKTNLGLFVRTRQTLTRQHLCVNGPPPQEAVTDSHTGTNEAATRVSV